MKRRCGESPEFGTTRLDFDVDRHGGFILLPTDDRDLHPRPWVWYAPSFIGTLPKPRHVWYITRLLARGICVCGVDVGESWGSPAGREIYTAFHKVCTQEFDLAPRAMLWCQSRGGLMHYNWAAEHPESVKCIGGIYPLVNAGMTRLKGRILEAFGMDEEAFTKELAEHNPIDRLQPLAEHGVPIFHVHGDVDEPVPLESNSAELARRYEALGGNAAVLVVKGRGHEEVKEFFECRELVDFFVRHGTSHHGDTETQRTTGA